MSFYESILKNLPFYPKVSSSKQQPSNYYVSRGARIWSNKELKKFAHLFAGDIINVSAWRDEDKEGKLYRDYFINSSSYHISNYPDPDALGSQGEKDEILLDLTQELPESLENRFDVAYNHTTLEHIFDVHKAVKNICKLSRDVVVIVVPFMQPSHELGTLCDYWRFTPRCVRLLLEDNGFSSIYESTNVEDKVSVYLFFIAVRDVGKWKDKIEMTRLPEKNVGIHLTQ